MIGRVISHYEILEKLGGGGMGVVYKARDTKLDRHVALKFLPPELGADDEANRRFMQEAKAASALDHPNICTIYEVGEAADGTEMKGRLFISMAFYDGLTLKQRLREEARLKPSEAVKIARQIAEGLAAAHKRGIVHRDIKPANIMVTQEGLVKILDFGLAKLAGGIPLTKTGSTLGTAGYMAPEQVRAESVDHRADLWSLGVVLSHMLTGRLPFEGEYEQAIAYSILNEAPEISGDVSEELQVVVERLLEKDPSARFGAATDVARALEQVPEVKPAVPTLEADATKPHFKIIVVVAVALLAVVLLAWFLLQPGSTVVEEEVDPNAIAVMPFTVRGDPELEYLAEGLVDLFSVKLDGAGRLRAVDANAVLGRIAKEDVTIETPDDALLLARRLGARRAVIGNVVRIGQDIRVSASLYEDSGEPEVTASTTVESEDQLTGSLDELAREMVGNLVRDSPDEMRSLAAITTQSLPALKDYLKGEQALRRARWNEAVEAFRAAVDEDSTFALAWSRLAYAAGWTVDVELEFLALGKALSLRHALPDRMQKLVEADYYAFREGDAERAFELYREVLSEHPNDVYALQKLGEMLYHYNPLLARPQSEAERYFTRALELAPDRGDNRRHLLDIYTEERRYDDLDSLVQVAMSSEVDSSARAFANEVMGIVRRAEGDSSWSFDLQGDLPAASINALGLIAVSQIEDIPATRQIVEAVIREDRFPEDYRRMYRFRLAELAAAEGKLREFNRRLERAEPDFVGTGVIQRTLVYAPPAYPAADSLLEGVRLEVVNWDTLSSPAHSDVGPANPLEGDYHLVKAYLLGLMAFRMGDRAAFEQNRAYVADRADPNAEPAETDLPRRGRGPHLAYSFQRTLEALAYWKDGRFEPALEAIRDARLRILWRASALSPIYDQVLNRFVLGELLIESGELEAARDAFRSLTAADHTNGLIYLGPSYMRLAEIHERLGDREKAIEYYARLVRLWKNCDPELIPIREDARRNLDRLLEESVREPAAG